MAVTAVGRVGVDAPSLPLAAGLPWSLPLTLVVYGVVVVAAAWIFRDARARGSRYAVVWGLSTLVFTILPVLAYLYLHRDAGPAR